MRSAVRLCCAGSEPSDAACRWFPAYEFGTQRTWNGVSLVAVCRDGADRAGTYAVITSDPGEMRHALTREADIAHQPGTSNDVSPGAGEGHRG